MHLQLVFGNCGVLQGISQGKGFVNMSTIDVETATDVCEVNSSYTYLQYKEFGAAVYYYSVCAFFTCIISSTGSKSGSQFSSKRYC